MNNAECADRNEKHWDGRHFFNPGAQANGLAAFLRWMTHRHRRPWRTHIPSTPGPRPVERVDGSGLLVTLVGHATVLLQTRGMNFLTDPVWSERASPLQFMGPRRHRAPGLRFEDLPPIDAILLSHNHYDHMDLPTLRRLRQAHSPAIFCPLGLADPLRTLGFASIYEMDWWQQTTWRGLEVHCMPAQHFSARTPFDRNRTLWCGWVLDHAGNEAAGDAREPIYFAADTGFGPHFALIHDRFPHLRLAMLPIGAYAPEWFMGPIHMTPEQAVEAHRILGSPCTVPIHYGTFSLADDGEGDAEARLSAALGERDAFAMLEEGHARAIPTLTL